MDGWGQLQHFSEWVSDDQAPKVELKQAALLTVMVVEARNLACLDAVPPLQPMMPHAYVSCGFGSLLKTTETATQGTDPKFDCILKFGAVDVAPGAPPLRLNVCAVDATPFLQLTDSLGSAELDLLSLFAHDREFQLLVAGAENSKVLIDAWVALEGAGTGEVHFRLLLRSTDCPACDLSLNALALSEHARAGAQGQIDSNWTSQSLEMVALQRSTARHLELLETRQFWNWVRTLQANPWLLSEPDSHAMAQQRGENFVGLVRAGLPSQQTANRFLQQVVFTGDADQSYEQMGQRQHLSNIAAHVTG